ncbi:MAG TPA: peptide ABC transporter substrate-binding protein, partial [Chloroflexota bacterium]|nr:peptide ABC transporter substrate-binding protein [Chloroflexota bacterium]
MRPFLTSTLACLALVATSACGPSGQPAPAGGGGANNVTVATPPPVTGATPSSAGAPTAAPAAQPTQPAQAASQPAGPQEITVNVLQGEPDNLDPNRSNFATEAAVVRQVFEPLLVFDKDLKPAPGAASSYDVSADGKTYTFHLKQGAKWSDGQPVTAKDFVYSFTRLLDPATAADYASFFTDAGIVGATDFNAGKGSADALGVRAKDDNTLEVQLEQPSGYFPNLAALWVVAPVRQDVVAKGPGWAQDPSTYIGNGPFKMSEWVHQDHITLVPNANYVGTKPNLTKVTFLMVTSGEADYAAYRNNERDWTLVPDADVAAVRADPQLSKEAHEYTELTTFWLVMNNGKAPFNNPLVRKAFARAIDRDAMIRDIASGVGKPALSFIPPGMPGFQADLGKDIVFDAAAAKDLLKQAGYADPTQFPPVTFRFGTTSSNQSRAEFIQAQLKQNLGVTIQLDSMESKAYQAVYKAKDYDLAWTGWGADYPDPQNWMAPLFGCNASNNKYNYCNPQFDAAANKGDVGTDLNVRLQAYAQAQGILETDLPTAPLFYRGRMV